MFRLDRDPKVGKKQGDDILVYVKDHLSVMQVEHGRLCNKNIEVLTLILDLKCV